MENSISCLLTFSHSFRFHKSTFSEKKTQHKIDTINAAARLWSNLIKRLKSLSFLSFSFRRYLSGLAFFIRDFSSFHFEAAKLQLQSVMELRILDLSSHQQYCSKLLGQSRGNRSKCFTHSSGRCTVAKTRWLAKTFFNSKFWRCWFPLIKASFE